VVKYANAVEVCIVVAAVLAAAADAMLMAHNLPKLGAPLVTARRVQGAAWRQEAHGRKKTGVRGALSWKAINNSAAGQENIYMCTVAS
jgi:hypothetical protein